jgi:hypothetical protein
MLACLPGPLTHAACQDACCQRLRCITQHNNLLQAPVCSTGLCRCDHGHGCDICQPVALTQCSSTLPQETGGADLFIGFGGVVARQPVMMGADWFVYDYQDLIHALRRYTVRVAELAGWFDSIPTATYYLSLRCVQSVLHANIRLCLLACVHMQTPVSAPTHVGILPLPCSPGGHGGLRRLGMCCGAHSGPELPGS